jgi:hypothetical protein
MTGPRSTMAAAPRQPPRSPRRCRQPRWPDLARDRHTSQRHPATAPRSGATSQHPRLLIPKNHRNSRTETPLPRHAITRRTGKGGARWATRWKPARREDHQNPRRCLVQVHIRAENADHLSSAHRGATVGGASTIVRGDCVDMRLCSDTYDYAPLTFGGVGRYLARFPTQQHRGTTKPRRDHHKDQPHRSPGGVRYDHVESPSMASVRREARITMTKPMSGAALSR